MHRGDLEGARANLARMSALAVTDDVEARHCFVSLDGLIALGEGDLDRALELLGHTAREGVESQGASSEGTRLTWADAIGAALEVRRLDHADALVALLADRPRGLVPPLLRAELARGRRSSRGSGTNRTAAEQLCGRRSTSWQRSATRSGTRAPRPTSRRG